MTPERRKQIEQLYRSALGREADERESFLEQACAGDYELRREVSSLLANDNSSASFTSAATLLDQRTAHEIGPYKIEALIGRGGMGEVHLAFDSRLNRKVAIKLLPVQFTQDAERVRRFMQEARAASALNHPNVITIFDIGEAEGAHYLVMEYVGGATLRRRISDAPQRMIKPVEAIELSVQVVEALAAAHETGIVHRDIKPENVMIRQDGLVKVLDFGLARLTSPRSAPVDSQTTEPANVHTAPGVVLGTAAYMSPEQARGLNVDQRSDIFSLGVMLYEMLAGQRPFQGSTMSDVMAAILTREPEPLSRHNKDVELRLEQIVLRCLAKDPAQRFQTARELAEALKTLTASEVTKGDGWRRVFRSQSVRVVSVLVVLLIAGFAYWKLQGNTPSEVQIRSLAVLPLENLSGDPGQEYFVDGMTEALINNLAQIRALRVISRASVMRFKGSNKPLPEIAQELNNVDAVLTGSVQRHGGKVKISAQLIRVATDSHLWARDYDREMADVLKLQSQVARAVAEEIRVEVTAGERAQLAAARSIKPEAYEAYQLARYHASKWNEDDLRQAIEYYERAIQIDPDYAAAWAGLSRAWRLRGIWGTKQFREVEVFSRRAAIKAVELDSNLAEAHVELFFVKFSYDIDWSGSEREINRALELDPGSRDVHHAYANQLMALGRHDEAIREVEILERLDPLSTEIQTASGRVFYRAGRLEEAERYLKRAIELDSRNFAAYGRLADVYVQMRRFPEALDSLEKSVQTTNSNRTPFYFAQKARAYAEMGKRDEARELLRKLTTTTQSDRLPYLAIAAAYTALGNKDEAFKLIFRAISEQKTYMVFVKEDPPLKDLHSDARWKEVIRRMNFPDG